ncbi:hypothetical protein T07_250 [Trichinella nelsoni]|uniref:Uncharacterized protein n=1 Tax=Trichinella nelsoni TaxID=6336 RepID=A0A0V0RD38_9BILA|nr:hypothetical protein T07_250 [Trichinella nelsoni]
MEHSVTTNHVWRERKETMRTNVGRSAKRHTSTLCGRCVAFFTCVFVCVRVCGWGPANTASSGMVLVNPFVSSFGGEAQ